MDYRPYRNTNHTVKPVQNGYSQKDKKNVFITNYRLIQVINIAECSISINRSLSQLLSTVA